MVFFWGCFPDSDPNTAPMPHFYGVLTDLRLFGGSEEELARELIQLHQGGFAMVGSTQSTDGDFRGRI